MGGDNDTHERHTITCAGGGGGDKDTYEEYHEVGAWEGGDKDTQLHTHTHHWVGVGETHTQLGWRGETQIHS